MRKIYLMATLLGAGSLAFGQAQAPRSPHAKLVNTKQKAEISNQVTQNKALGQLLYHDNFDSVVVTPIGGTASSMASNWTVATDGTPPVDNTYGWQVGTTYYSWHPSNNGSDASSSFNSTSGGTFAQVNNGDPTAGTQALDVVYTLTSDPIDVASLITGSEKIVLTFEQLGARFYDRQEVLVSTDGSTWTSVYDNGAKTMLSTSGGSFYPNPDYILVPIQSAIEGGESSVQIRFSWTTDIPSEATNPNVWVTYGWLVDDVQLSTMADNDIATVGSVDVASPLGYNYDQVPLSQVQPLSSSIVAKNMGAADQTNVQLNVTEANVGAYTASSAATTLLYGQEDSLVISTPFEPTATGTYQLDFSITADATDDIPSNNVMASYTFDVTDYLYARDEAGELALDPTQTLGITSGYDEDPTVSDAIEAGNVFEIVGSDPITAIEFRLGHENLEPGSLVFAQIYDGNLDVPVTGGADIGPYIVQAGDEGKYVSIPLNAPLTLAPGEYVAVVGSETPKFSLANYGTSKPQTSFVYYYGEQTWYYMTSTPIVRINFDPTVGLAQNEMGNLTVSSTYPNPFANATTVQFNLKETSNVSYTVVDLAGNVVTAANQGNTLAGDHEISIDGSNLSNGVYFLKLQAGNAVVTHKLVVNK